MRSTSFVAQLQSPEVTEPTERALDEVARLAKSAAVGTRSSERRQERFDPQPFDEVNVSVVPRYN